MDVTEAIATRRSVRGFLDTTVDPALLRNLAVKAARAATGGNLQPWHIAIVHGEPLARLKAIMAEKIATGATETPAYDIYPKDLAAPYRDRRFAVGEAMYAHLGIPRDDKVARRNWFARNFDFFGAPAAYFCTVDKQMGPPQWSDLGMYLQNLMLLAVEAGLATCPQECWAMYPETVGAVIGMTEDRMLFCGMAIGYEDTSAMVNRLRTERAEETEWLTTIKPSSLQKSGSRVAGPSHLALDPDFRQDDGVRWMTGRQDGGSVRRRNRADSKVPPSEASRP